MAALPRQPSQHAAVPSVPPYLNDQPAPSRRVDRIWRICFEPYEANNAMELHGFNVTQASDGSEELHKLWNEFCGVTPHQGNFAQASYGSGKLDELWNDFSNAASMETVIRMTSEAKTVVDTHLKNVKPEAGPQRRISQTAELVAAYTSEHNQIPTWKTLATIVVVILAAIVEATVVFGIVPNGDPHKLSNQWKCGFMCSMFGGPLYAAALYRLIGKILYEETGWTQTWQLIVVSQVIAGSVLSPVILHGLNTWWIDLGKTPPFPWQTILSFVPGINLTFVAIYFPLHRRARREQKHRLFVLKVVLACHAAVQFGIFFVVISTLLNSTCVHMGVPWLAVIAVSGCCSGLKQVSVAIKRVGFLELSLVSHVIYDLASKTALAWTIPKGEGSWTSLMLVVCIAFMSNMQALATYWKGMTAGQMLKHFIAKLSGQSTTVNVTDDLRDEIRLEAALFLIGENFAGVMVPATLMGAICALYFGPESSRMGNLRGDFYNYVPNKTFSAALENMVWLLLAGCTNSLITTVILSLAGLRKQFVDTFQVLIDRNWQPVTCCHAFFCVYIFCVSHNICGHDPTFQFDWI